MSTKTSIPFFPYRLFFIYIEPFFSLLGSYYAARPAEYLQMLEFPPTTLGSISKAVIPLTTTISLFQLSNLYLLFALNECLVLSSTNSVRVWRRLLFCLLIADFGHLCTLIPLGSDVYWQVGQWNAMAWGNVAFVYIGASMRMAFLLGVGLGSKGGEGGLKAE